MMTPKQENENTTDSHLYFNNFKCQSPDHSAVTVYMSVSVHYNTYLILVPFVLSCKCVVALHSGHKLATHSTGISADNQCLKSDVGL